MEGRNRTLCTRTQKKGAVIPWETDPYLPVSVQESPVEVCVSGGLLLGSSTECRVCACSLLKEVTIVFITSNIVWLQVNIRAVVHVIRLTSFL